MSNSVATGTLSLTGRSAQTLDADLERSLVASTGYLLARIGMQSRRLWTRTLADHRLTPHQFGVVMSLGQLGSASQRSLSRMLGIDPRNAMPVLDTLEKRRLIERAADPADRRRHAVTLTAAGRKKLRELGRMGETIEQSLLKSLTRREQRQLHTLLVRVFASLAH